MAHKSSWPLIQTQGLLSTSALLDLFEIKGAERTRIEEQRRNETVSITHSIHGTAYIRDQKPLRMSQLASCLEGITPANWLKLLSSKVFLWPNSRRVQALSKARAYRDQAHCLIAVDTIGLLCYCANNISLTPINIGSTLYNPPKRSPDTFSSLADFPKRKSSDKIAEVAVDHSISHLHEIVNSVKMIRNGKCIKRIR